MLVVLALLLLSEIALRIINLPLNRFTYFQSSIKVPLGLQEDRDLFWLCRAAVIILMSTWRWPGNRRVGC